MSLNYFTQYKCENFNNFKDDLIKLIYEDKNGKSDKSIFKTDFVGDDDFKGSIRAMTVKPWDLEMVELTDDEIHQNRKKIKIEFSLQRELCDNVD